MNENELKNEIAAKRYTILPADGGSGDYLILSYLQFLNHPCEYMMIE
jgi:hypothetical protein